MESFYLITPIALILIAVAIKLFIWAVNSGQFDDLDREASRILFDDETVRDKNSSHGANESTDNTRTDNDGSDAHDTTQDKS